MCEGENTDSAAEVDATPKLTEEIKRLAALPDLDGLEVAGDKRDFLKNIAENTRPNILRDIAIAAAAGVFSTIICIPISYFLPAQKTVPPEYPATSPPSPPAIWQI